MSGEEENKLDGLFKSGLDKPDTHFEYNSQDWDSMEQLLDAHKKPRAPVYWLPILSGVAAMLLLAAGLWWFYQPVKVQQPLQVKTKPVKAPVVQQPSANRVENNALSTAGDVTRVGTTPILRQPSTHVKKGKAVYAELQNLKDNTLNENNIKPAGTANNNSIKYDQASPKQGVKTTGNAATALTNGTALTFNSTVDSSSLLVNKPLLAGINPDSAAGKDQTVARSKKIKTEFPGRRGPRLGLAMLVSPDVNGVGSFQSAKVGTNIGLLFSVGISKRLTISTGAAYSRKPYMTGFNNYHTAYQFKTNPEDVYADCRVLDIPVNIDYKVYGKRSNSFSIGSGLSSYIMLKEKYTYDYAVPNTPGPTQYTVSNQNKHILGVLNLNATYQHQLNAKFSIAAQPYLKIPLTNIGYSEVKLQSAGVAVGLRWNVNSQ